MRSLVVITSGLDAAACAALLAVCRRHGMRLVGLDGFGVAVPSIGLTATFAASPPRPGVAGLVMQSGGLGFALVDRPSELGVGISVFASVGPRLDGRTVAIVSNVGSAGLLAADACTDRGLTVYRSPIDMTATVRGEDFRQCLELLAAQGEVDALIAVVLPTGATGDLVQAVQQADVGIPLAAVVLNQPESVRLLPRPADGQVPAYGYPEAALARAATHGAWRAEPRGRVHDFPDIKTADARALTREFLRIKLAPFEPRDPFLRRLR